MQFPHKLFKHAGLRSTDVAALIGVSRITGYRWFKGREDGAGAGVNIFLRDRVVDLSKRVHQAVTEGRLPSPELYRLPPTDRVAALTDLLNIEQR